MNREIFEALRQSLDGERLCALATVVAGPGAGAERLLWPDGRVLGSLGSVELDAAVDAAAGNLSERKTERLSLEAGGEPAEVFLEVYAPPPQLVVVGAVHTAIALVGFANALGYRTLVVDPRGAFATAERFAHAYRLIAEWPPEAFEGLRLHERTAVAFLSHDLKLDLPALRLVLRSPVAYIGALGSKKTHAKRVAALVEEGFTEAEIGRIRSPIGLPLGGRSPEEIALSVMAEIVAMANGSDLTSR
jgi:xanthine dehydrogenase accessory factor